MLVIGLGFILPRWFDVFVPIERRGEGEVPRIPGVIAGEELSSQGTRSSDEKEPSYNKTKQVEDNGY